MGLPKLWPPGTPDQGFALDPPWALQPPASFSGFQVLATFTAGIVILLNRILFTQQGRNNKNVQHWWCSVRNSRLRCPAMVIQRGKSFMRGKRKHEHLVGQNTPKPHIHNYQKSPPTASSSTGAR